MVQKAFEIGNSVALTIPKKTGVKPGTRVKFQQKGNKLIYQLINQESDSPQVKQIEETSGAIHLNTDPKSLNIIIKRLKENPYDREVRLS